MKNSKHQLSSLQSTNTVDIFRITAIDKLKNNIQKIHLYQAINVAQFLLIDLLAIIKNFELFKLASLT